MPPTLDPASKATTSCPPRPRARIAASPDVPAPPPHTRSRWLTIASKAMADARSTSRQHGHYYCQADEERPLDRTSDPILRAGYGPTLSLQRANELTKFRSTNCHEPPVNRRTEGQTV